MCRSYWYRIMLQVADEGGRTSKRGCDAAQLKSRRLRSSLLARSLSQNGSSDDLMNNRRNLQPVHLALLAWRHLLLEISDKRDLQLCPLIPSQRIRDDLRRDGGLDLLGRVVSFVSANLGAELDTHHLQCPSNDTLQYFRIAQSSLHCLFR